MMTPRHDDTPYRGNYVWYIVGLVIALGGFVSMAYVAGQGKVFGWEHSWLAMLNGWPEALYRPMTIITFFGSLWMAALSVVGAFLVRFYRLAGRLALSIGLAYGLTILAKELLDRARPGELFETVHVRMVEVGMGFPSVHTAIITVIALSLLPYLKWRLRWIVPLCIGLVAVSRLYLGVHLPLDVCGGFAIGVSIVAAIRLLPQHLRVLLRID